MSAHNTYTATLDTSFNKILIVIDIFYFYDPDASRFVLVTYSFRLKWK